MSSRFLSFCAGALIAASLAAASAQPLYFREDKGVSSGATNLPADLNPPENLAWRVPLDPGHSTPIISGGKIFLTSSRSSTHELATVALDAQTGAILWRKAISTPKFEEVHPEEGTAAMATPACDGERLLVFFGSHGLICYDLNGKQLWDHPMGPFRDEYGAASSPIIVDGKVILNEDHDIDSFLTALDVSSGREIWKTSRPDAVRSYATPAVWEQNGKKELLIGGSLELSAYDLTNGEKLWWVNGLARIVIPTPLPVNDMIYMACWAPGGDAGRRISLQSWDQALEAWDTNKDGRLSRSEVRDGEVTSRFFRMDLNQDSFLDQSEWEHHAEVFARAENVLLALKPQGRGDLTRSAVVWKYQRGIPYVASPVVHDGILWMVKDGGLVTKLTLDGRVLQQERLGATGNYFSSPVAADGKVYFASESGVASVVADQQDWKLLSSRKFGEKIYATPLAVGGRLYIRTEKALYCFRQKESVH